MMHQQPMDRGVRILGGGVLVCLALINDGIVMAGRIAATVIGLYGIITGTIRYCPLARLIVKERKRLQTGAEAEQTAMQAKALSFFEGMSDKEIEAVLSCCDVRTYPAGAVILREGGTERRLVIVLSGACAVRKGSGQNVIETLGPGESFGEDALAADMPLWATLIATEETRVFEMKPEGFRRVIEMDPVLGTKFSQRLLMTLSRHLRALS